MTPTNEILGSIGKQVDRILRNTPPPDKEDFQAMVYYVRLQEVLDCLRRNGISCDACK